ncbi:MAG: prenyltransferase/squalene oxidase repeat-containing protein [Isosphaeraceae bacterium]
MNWLPTIAAVLGLIPPGSDPETYAPNSDAEPLAKAPSLPSAARFLDAVSLDWTRQRKCGTCHTNYAYLIARPTVAGGDRSAMDEIRGFFENRVAHWDDADKKAKPLWDTEVVATAATLALHDAATTGELHERTRQALDRIWTLQRPDGTWDWLKCDWPPYEHDDDYGACFAAVGVGAAPGDYKNSPSAREGLARLVRYLKETPPPSPHHRAMRLWASARLDGVMDAEAKAGTVAELKRMQRPDGGWNLPSLGDWARHDGSKNDPEGPSDGFATGFVVHVLRESGVALDDPAVARGIAWLKAHQRESGRWFTRSVSNDKAHYITHAGTAFAILALRGMDEARAAP